MPSSDRAKVEAWVREFGVGPEPNMEFMLDVTDLVALYRAGQVDGLDEAERICDRRASKADDDYHAAVAEGNDALCCTYMDKRGAYRFAQREIRACAAAIRKGTENG